MGSRKAYVIGIAVLVVVIAGVVGIRLWKASKSRQAFAFDTAKVERGALVAKVTATGTLSAIVTVQVGSQVSGTIAVLKADFNSAVHKGELIAKIDPRLFDAAVQQARANLIAAEGNLAKAKAQAVDADRQYQRNVTLAAKKFIAQADLDTSQSTADADRAAVDAAAGTVEQAKAQLNTALVNLAYTDIICPTDGTVISRNVDVGQTVAASFSAPVLFLIAQDLNKMQVDTSVAESDIGKLKPQMRATFTVDAYPTEKFTGIVRQVRNSPQTVQNVVTYDAVIDVPNPDLKLKPGMTANCTFIYAERDEALRVPNSALRFRPPAELLASLHPGGKPEKPKREGGGERASGTGAGAGPATGTGGRGGPWASADPSQKSVWVLKDGKAKPVRLKTGVSDGSWTEVVQGELAEGDLVITDIASGAAKTTQATPPGGAMPRRMF